MARSLPAIIRLRKDVGHASDTKWCSKRWCKRAARSLFQFLPFVTAALRM